ncbi:MAG: DUF3857 domain-containing protein, partial [Sphingobacteriales bacterium]
IKYIKGFTYDAQGLPTGKISEKNFRDVYVGNDFSLFEDSRMKYFKPAITTYPYTIEYEYEVRSNETMSFNDWMPTNTLDVAVEKSIYTFSCFPEFDIRYKAFNMQAPLTTGTNASGLKTYTWTVNNLKASKIEPYSPQTENFLPMVKIAPVSFKYQNISGSFTNWNELGKWIYDKLLTGRDNLDAATVSHIKQLTAGITDPKLKAKKIYEFMQQKTRYISIQIGIGGYRPFPASEVDMLGYGDCKALSNYMRALLKAVDIESYYCQVYAGDDKKNMDVDFASMTQANHAILCLPFKNDTTFLECTSQKAPFGFLGDFTDDRTVLACTPQGGKLIHTPKYTTEVNAQLRKAVFTIDTTGTLTGNMQTTYKGTQYDNRERIVQEKPLDRIKEYKKIYPINNIEIEKLELTQDKSLQPVTSESLVFNAYDYAAVETGKMYFTPNIVNRRKTPLREVRNRKNVVYIGRGYTDEDEIIYNIPAGYKFEKQPLDVNLNKPFGKYAASVTLADNKLVYKRRIQLMDGTYSKETYPELVAFFQSIVDADQYSVMMSKDAEGQ